MLFKVTQEFNHIDFVEALRLLWRKHLKQLVVRLVHEILPGQECLHLVAQQALLCWLVCWAGFKRLDFGLELLCALAGLGFLLNHIRLVINKFFDYKKMSSVKVAVRVRPFNEREQGSKCCIRMVRLFILILYRMDIRQLSSILILARTGRSLMTIPSGPTMTSV